MKTFCLVFSESEDEVEELERVRSPDVAPEDSAPFYDSTAWCVQELRVFMDFICELLKSGSTVGCLRPSDVETVLLLHVTPPPVKQNQLLC